MKKFKGFTNQQTHTLLQEMGYTGPAQKDDMDAFLASSPSAASKLGRYADIARQRIEGGPLAPTGFSTGGGIQTIGSGKNTYYKVGESTFEDYTSALHHYNTSGGEASFGPLGGTTTTTPTTTTTTQDTGNGVEQQEQQQEDTGDQQQEQQQQQEEKQPPEGSQVLKPGTPTPEVSEAATLLDDAQKAYAASTRALTEIQQAMSGKDPEEVYKTRDYTSVADGTDAERSGASEALNAVLLKHITGLKELTPEEITKYDTNGDGVVDLGDVNAISKMGLGLKEPSDAFTEFFLNKYPNTPVTYQQALEEAELAQTQAAANTKAQQEAYKIEDIPSTAEALGKAITNPSSVLAQPTVYGLKVENNQLIDEGTGQVATAASLLVKQAQAADAVEDPKVKATMAYLNKFSNKELAEKYPLPEFDAIILPIEQLMQADESSLSREQVGIRRDFFSKLQQRQAQIEQDAVADRAETFTAVKSEEKIKALDELGKYAEGVLSEDAKMKAETMTPEDLAQLKGKYADPAKLESYNLILNEDDIVRINQEREELKVAMTVARLNGDSEGFAALEEAYNKAGDSVRKAYETGTVVGNLEEDQREFPTAATFAELGGYTEAEAAEVEKETALGDIGDVEAAKFATDTPKAEAAVDYNLPPTQIAEIEKTKVEDAAKFDEYATADEKKSEFVPDITAEETTVGTDEVVDVNKIINSEEVIVAGKTLEALNEASTAKAATATFTQQLAAKAVKGEVSAASTVQFQMEKLMKSFDNGTPAWAAGALRKANAAMSARGLGNSSMASAAIIQATLESAIPIAQQDAATFAAMDMENVRNEQAVALANAAAAQNFELANLSNEQAVRIQNSMNNANLQLKNLSNEQEAVLATAQFKAALQGQELSISANVALANAARYAAVNDINLTNRQQTSILKSTQNLEVEMANLSNAQQTALSNLQVKAAMMGQELSNEQQMAVLESTQAFEVNMQDATMKQQAFIQDAVARAAMEGRVLDNKQQTALFNVANIVAERGIELNNEQQTAIFNMSNRMTIATEEMSARQQTALANAQIEAAMKGQELTNKQQVSVIKAERIAEIANMNFTAEQSRALQNAQLTQTVDLANLSNAQAKLLADCAALTDVDMANLNNRQQAAAQQAQAFLQMDMANLDNEQQAVMFEAQSLVQSIFSDQAAENAQLQFNAESINQVNQFYEGLTTQISQFNVAQANAMEQFNAGEENSMTKFQAELDNQRDMFNAQNELVIAQANTVWRQTVATANTAALNEANMAEVMAANNLTMQGLAELWQQERDLMDFAWRSANNQLERDHQLLVQKISNDNAEDAARGSAAGNLVSSLFNAALDLGVGYISSQYKIPLKTE